MFGINSINGSVQWLGVPDFLRTNGPAWTANLLAPHTSWGDRGSSTNKNRGSQSEGHSDSVSIPWNRPTRVYPIYHCRIFEHTRSAARRVRDDLIRANPLVRMKSPNTFRNPIRNPRGQQDDEWDDIWDEPVYQ